MRKAFIQYIEDINYRMQISDMKGAFLDRRNGCDYKAFPLELDDNNYYFYDYPKSTVLMGGGNIIFLYNFCYNNSLTTKNMK